MSKMSHCSQCKHELSDSTAARLCPICLLDLGLEINVAPPKPISSNFAGRQLGNYVVLGELGRGGMGVVLKARQINLDRIVAIKLLGAGEFASPSEVGRFLAEAEAAANLRHPNIVGIYEIGQHNGLHFFSMEYVSGRDLGALLANGALAARRAARYTQRIARAIHHAHESGIIHRDLKPSNVLIDADDEPRVTDFGIAKRLANEKDLTVTGVIIGTPSYMSPEQAKAQRGTIGPASDIYSVGAILYHLLTGHPPFIGRTLEDTLVNVLEQEVTRPRVLNAGIPVDLENICLKCLAKEPSQRYGSGKDLAEDIERFLNGEPVAAHQALDSNFDQTHWAEAGFSQGYLEEADFVVPNRTRLFEVLRSFYLYHYGGGSAGHVCDLGCGDGVLAEQVSMVAPATRFTLIDGSREMLNAATQRLRGRASLNVIPTSFQSIIAGKDQFGPFDFVMSGLAIHHLHAAEKAALFQRLFGFLRPGGWFMNIDAILPDDPFFTDWYYELWREQILLKERAHQREQSSRNVPEQARHDADNKFGPLASQLRALKAAGFAGVECHLKDGLFAIYSGRRPKLLQQPNDEFS